MIVSLIMMVHKKNKQNGFTLLELLLVVAVLGLLTASAAAIFDQWFKDSIDRKVAREMQQLQNAAETYVELNINDFQASLLVGETEELPITILQANGFLPAGYEARNSYRQTLRVFVRFDSATTANGDVFEVITVSDDNGANVRRIPDSRLFRAATRSGQKSVGIISNLNISATCCNGNIQSANGEWSIPLTELAAAPTPYTATPNADGGYMAAYGRIFSTDTLTENYLYRFDVPEIANANLMETDLDVNTNDIENAGIMVVDAIEADSATISGNSFSRLPGQYAFATESDLNIGNNLNVNAGPAEQNGNITIIGDNGTAVDFVVSGDMNVLNAAAGGDGDVSADTLTAFEVDVAGESNFNTVNNLGADVIAGNIYATSSTYSNTVGIARDLQVSTANDIQQVTSGSAAIGQAIVSTGLVTPNNMQVDKNMNISGGVRFDTTGVGVIGRDEVTINTLNRPCGVNCP